MADRKKEREASMNSIERIERIDLTQHEPPLLTVKLRLAPASLALGALIVFMYFISSNFMK
jgi:hypothetical protein